MKILACRLVNDELQIWERKKDIIRGLPVERTHGKIIILPLTNGKLLHKIIKGIKTMRGIELFVVFSVAAFNFAVMSWCKRFNLLMSDTELIKRFLKERRRRFLAVPHLVCKFKSVIRLNAFNGIWKFLHNVLKKHG